MSSPEVPNEPTFNEKKSTDNSISEIASDHRSLVLGAALCGIGILVGTIALAVCCYSFGADFSGEGWGDQASSQPKRNQIWLVMSLVGFAVAIPLFWVGFFRIVHQESSKHGS